MKLHPIGEILQTVSEVMLRGGQCYQQWLCEHCDTKQTMEQPNAFYAKGECEECKKITDIEKNGCNLMTVDEVKPTVTIIYV